MDLTRLYNLTTPELREEAERLGVSETYAMSRGQLIHAIRGKADAPQEEGFLGKVFGFAKWALQAAGETSSGRQAAPSRKEDASHPPRDFGPSDSPVATESLDGEPASASAPAPSRKEDASHPPRDFGPSDSPTATEAESGTDGPPSRPPAGVFTPSAGLFEEPFPTRTMARILAEQGHFKRSLAIYARLVDEEPDDGELAAEAKAVRAQARARRSHAPQ